MKRWKAERRERQLVDRYERELRESREHELSTRASDHQVFHDREHALYDTAVETARKTMELNLQIVTADVDRLREIANSHLTIERFESQHSALIERMNERDERIQGALEVESRISARQQSKDEVLAGVSQNNRWLIALIVGNGLTLIALVLHLTGVY